MGESNLQLADQLIEIFKRLVVAGMPTRVLIFPRIPSSRHRGACGERVEWGAHPVVLFAVDAPVNLRAVGRDAIELRPGDALLLSARDLLDLKSGGQGGLVGIESLGSLPCRFFTIDAAEPSSSRRDLELFSMAPACDLPDRWKASHEIHCLLDSAIRQGRDSSNLTEPALRSVLKLATTEGSKALGLFRKFVEAPVEKSNFARVLAAEAFISLNIDRDIRKTELAQHLGVSVSQLTLAFREIGQLAVRDRIRFRRIESARNLLADTNLSVSEVAERVGMNYRHFIRAFRQNAGLTPLRFRKYARLDNKTREIWVEFLHTENFTRVEPLASLNGETESAGSRANEATISVLFSNASGAPAQISRLSANGEFADIGIAGAEKRLSFFDHPGSVWKAEARQDSDPRPIYFKSGEANSHFVFPALD